MKGLGDYTIPTANKFAADGDPKTLGEIYAYGFRNAHRLSWDMPTARCSPPTSAWTTIEEINIVRNGENYGWMKREGYWENGRWRGGALERAVPAAAECAGRAREGRLHLPGRDLRPRRGRASPTGSPITAASPRCAASSCSATSRTDACSRRDLAAMKKADDGIPQTVAPIEEIQLYVRDASGKRVDVSMRELVEQTMGAASRAPICTSAGPATASCSSRRGRTA